MSIEPKTIRDVAKPARTSRCLRIYSMLRSSTRPCRATRGNSRPNEDQHLCDGAARDGVSPSSGSRSVSFADQHLNATRVDTAHRVPRRCHCE